MKASFNLAKKNNISYIPSFAKYLTIHLFFLTREKKARDSRVLDSLWCPNIPQYTSVAGVYHRALH